ncbi:MAG TPA: hypothetical protein VKE92_07850 [Anaerolineales bacterium]|nr:hypothetical protein [Anaerolineales bacterium]
MRPLEFGIPLLLVIYLLFPRPRPFIIRALPAGALILTLIHFVTEGYRWQMIPLYVLTLALALVSMNKTWDMQPPVSYLTLRLAQGGALILLAVSMAIPILLPVPLIPVPSGPYQVGTRIYELTDAERQEIYSGQEEARRFMIQVWYPSEANSSEDRAPWMVDAEIFAPAIATYIDMPAFFLDHLALVKLPAYHEPKVAASNTAYPVILFSHGWNGFSAQNSSQAIQLASHGYVVIGIQHTYGAIITVFSDGTVAKNNPSALPEGTATEEYETAAHILSEQWAGDLGLTLDYMGLHNNNPDSPFYTLLDLSRVGVYGHSTGGGAAIKFCGKDLRCKAVLGMDPFMRPVSTAVIENGLSQPAFFMFSQRWADDLDSRNNQLFRKFIPHVKQSSGVITINGTAHYDFTDIPLLSPLAPWLGLKGPINGELIVTIVNDYLLSFFDMTLKGGSTNLFDGQNSTYSEVRVNQ